jgi:hypothetical protein
MRHTLPRSFLCLLSAIMVLLMGSAVQAAPVMGDAGTEPMINGGFEQDFFGWNIMGAVSASKLSTSVVHGGSQSYHVDTTTTARGSDISQSLRAEIMSFELSAWVYRQAGDDCIELVRNWDPQTGHADLVTGIYFARPPTDTIKLQAWNTQVLTDLTWPPDGWHELRIVADAVTGWQWFYRDGDLLAAVQGQGAFVPEYVIVGDVAGAGTQASYYIDDISIAPLQHLHRTYLPVIPHGTG